MKRALILLILSLSVLACDLSVIPQLIGIESGGIITKVTMAEAVRGIEKDPIGETSTFKPTSIFHAVVTIKNAPGNSKFKVAWYTADVGTSAKPNSLIDEAELTAEGTRNLDFFLTPTSTWPPGSYKAEIYLNNKLDRTINFSVK